MPVTKKDISAIFNVPTANITQVGSKQMFKVTSVKDKCFFLLSYRTIIGIYHDNIWKITTKKYSSTTSRQITAFSHSRGDRIKRVDNEELVNLLPNSLKYYARQEDTMHYQQVYDIILSCWIFCPGLGKHSFHPNLLNKLSRQYYIHSYTDTSITFSYAGHKIYGYYEWPSKAWVFDKTT